MRSGRLCPYLAPKCGMCRTLLSVYIYINVQQECTAALRPAIVDTRVHVHTYTAVVVPGVLLYIRIYTRYQLAGTAVRKAIPSETTRACIKRTLKSCVLLLVRARAAC